MNNLIRLNGNLICVYHENEWFVAKRYSDEDEEFHIVSKSATLEEALKNSLIAISEYCDRLEGITMEFCEKFSGDGYPSREFELKRIECNYDSIILENDDFSFICSGFEIE